MNQTTFAKIRIKAFANAIILLTCFAVIIVYIGVMYLSFKDKDFEPNAIGDTLGGTLSPLIGLVSAVLIYVTIDQQIEANRIIQKQFSVERKEKAEEVIFTEVIKGLEEVKIKMVGLKIKDPMGNEIDQAGNKLKGSDYNWAFFRYQLYLDTIGLQTLTNIRIREDCAREYFLLFKEYFELLRIAVLKITTQDSYLFILNQKVIKDIPNYFVVLSHDIFQPFIETDSNLLILGKLLNRRVFSNVKDVCSFLDIFDRLGGQTTVVEDYKARNEIFINHYRGGLISKIEVLLENTTIIERCHSPSNNRIMGLIDREEEKKRCSEASRQATQILKEFKSSNLFSFKDMEGLFQWWSINYDNL